MAAVAPHQGLSPAASRLFRIRKTVCKMLDKRGYEVPQEDRDMTNDEFTLKFGEVPTRASMSIMVGQREAPDDKLIVFFPETDLGVKECKP